MNTLGAYKNGNYTVTIYEDGTKILNTDDKEFIASTIDSFDFKITDCCDMQCKFCHENSTPYGKHADILSDSFIDKLHPYTEIAIGGGNPISHPDLLKFLMKCKKLKLIPNITINQKHFMDNIDIIDFMVENKYIYGIGISLTSVTTEFIKQVKRFPNAVIHVINGIVTMEQLQKLRHNNLKILVLGYKEFRRGLALYNDLSECTNIEHNKNDLRNNIKSIIDGKWFNVVSFDNLALEQLDVKSILSEQHWNEFYMGDDGISGNYNSATMYVDMVNKKFAKNSCEPINKRFDLLSTAEEMFNILKTTE